MTDPDFGLDPITGKPMDFYRVVSELMAEAPKLSQIDTSLLLLDRYENFYGIHDHDSEINDRPLALIALNPAEDLSKIDPFVERATLFAERDVVKYFGLSFNEFLSMPHYKTTEILEICRKKQEKESKVVNDLNNQINTLKNQISQGQAKP